MGTGRSRCELRELCRDPLTASGTAIANTQRPVSARTGPILIRREIDSIGYFPTVARVAPRLSCCEILVFCAILAKGRPVEEGGCCEMTQGRSEILGDRGAGALRSAGRARGGNDELEARGVPPLIRGKAVRGEERR